ncbi:MAG: signal peptidase I, partial [Actinomycetota bacterium]|nr:signal peptidase I [Actinomycetota bacterium]
MSIEPGVHVRVRGTGERVAVVILIPLLVLFVSLVTVFYVIFERTRVEGDSMQPTLLTEDRLLMTRGYTQPLRGDIVVVHPNGQAGTENDLVKRVVALPGDRIEINRDIATVNGIAETGYGLVIDPNDTVTLRVQTVASGHVFIMGDNRAVSLD